MFLAVFLVSLDQTITATAMPRIASEFNSLREITWIASGYLLTQAGLIMLYGQLLALFSTKWVFMSAVGIFEIGSLICGTAPTINVLILGRAFAGSGGAGVFVSVLAIIAQIAAISVRSLIFATFAGVFAISSVCGPLIGGAFSDKVTWRWCFYINLPLGAISLAVIMWLIEARPPIGGDANDTRSSWRRVLRLDWLGAIVSVAWVTFLVLALTWGGNEKPWNDPAVIASFVVFGVLLMFFIGWEYYMGPRALVPLKLFRKRTQVGAVLEAFFVMLAMLIASYYLPLFYQSKGHSATNSAINILPYMLSTVASAMCGGLLIRVRRFSFPSCSAGAVSQRFGYYWPFLFFLPWITCIASGLMYTIKPSTSNSTVIGLQIVFGIGIGATMQNTIIAVQGEYNDEQELIPQATSVVNFGQTLGGVIGISIAGSIFANQLTKEITIYAPQVPPAIIQEIRESVTVVNSLPPAVKAQVIAAYTAALDYVYIIGVPAAGLASASALFIKNRNLNKLASGER